MNIFILTHQETKDTVSPNVFWDNWGTTTTYTLRSAYTIQPEINSPGLEFSKFSLPLSDTAKKVFALVMRYSELDSFGSNEGKGEILWTYTSESTANDALKAVESQLFSCKHKSPSILQIPLEMDSGAIEIHTLQSPASNCRDYVESVYISEVPLVF